MLVAENNYLTSNIKSLTGNTVTAFNFPQSLQKESLAMQQNYVSRTI